jgi:hypothetical protein
MTDLSTTIAPKSDQLNADDLISGPRTITITGVSYASAEQPIAISFEGDDRKPYMPCKSMRRVLVQVWGKDGNQYTGRSLTLYRDKEVIFGGQPVGGIRISHMTGIDKAVTMALTATRASRKPFTVKPLAIEQKTTTQPKRTMGDLLLEIQAELDNFRDEDEVKNLAQRDIVQKVLAAQGTGAAKLNQMIKSALDRVSVDVPTEDEAEIDPGADFDAAAAA